MKKRTEDGFGIVEVLVAMTIMSLVIMAVAPFLINAFKLTARNIRIAGATELVNESIAVLQSSTNTQSCASFASHLQLNPSSTVFTDTERSIRYRIAYSIPEYDPANPNGFIQSCQAAVDADQPRSYFYWVQVFDERQFQEDPTVAPLAEGRTWIAVPGLRP